MLQALSVLSNWQKLHALTGSPRLSHGCVCSTAGMAAPWYALSNAYATPALIRSMTHTPRTQLTPLAKIQLGQSGDCPMELAMLQPHDTRAGIG